MTKNNNPTFKEIYQLIDQKVGEVNASIIRLEAKFDSLEQGRLSRLETSFAELQGRIVATTSVVAFIISTIVAVVGFLFKK